MLRKRLILGIVSGFILFFFSSAGEVLAQEGVVLQLAPSRDSGVSGTATLREMEGNIEVELIMQGLPVEGVKHINHIHAGGTCADDRAGNPAPATIPLTTVEANADGTGSASTTLKDITLAELFEEDQERYLAFHGKVENEPVPPVISCADVERTSAEGATGNLPQSGGPPLVALIAGPFLVLAGSLGLTILRRCQARSTGSGRS